MKHNNLPLQSKEIVSVDQLIEKIERITFDFDTYYQHAKRGTLQLYYQQVVSEIAKDIVFMPFVTKLTESTVDVSEKSNEIVEHFSEIVESLATFFTKDKNAVYEDLLAAMARCPVEDLKVSLFLKKKNRLH